MALKFQKLTRHAIRALGAGDSITEHGITCERLTNGDVRYSVNIMVDGQRIHRVVGRESDGTTRTQVEDFISKVRNDAKHDRLALPKGRKVALSFRDAAQKYLSRLEEEGGKDIHKKRTRLNLHLIPFFRDVPLSKLTRFDVERYKKHRLQQRAIASTSGNKVKHKDSTTSPGTVNRELAVLSHLLSKAAEWGWISSGPKVKRTKEEASRITYLTVEQIKELIECAKGDSNPQIYPFILIGLETAMRMSEILNIRKEHVDLERRVIRIPTAKAGARDQPITEHLATFLTAMIDASAPGIPWLFPSASAKCGHTVTIRKPFRRVVAAAGLDPGQVVRHTLRHTAITHLVQAGVDLPTVKRISGHKTLAMVERYSHQNGEHIQQAMDKLGDRYRAAEKRQNQVE